MKMGERGIVTKSLKPLDVPEGGSGNNGMVRKMKERL